MLGQVPSLVRRRSHARRPCAVTEYLTQVKAVTACQARSPRVPTMASTDPEDGAAPLEEPLLEATTDEQVPVSTELADLLGLTAAFFVSSVSWVAMKSTDTAILGHVGTRYLDATALSDLYTMSTGVSRARPRAGQVLRVSQAIGADNKKLTEPGSRPSYAVLSLVLTPVAVAWLFTGPALQTLREESYVGEGRRLLRDHPSSLLAS